MMKKDRTAFALLINDIHLSKDNTVDFNKNWDEALSVCEQHGIEFLVIGGDLWQSRSGQTLNVLMTARAAILRAIKAGLKVIIESGNHDKVDPESVFSYNHIFSHLKNVRVVDETYGLQVSEDVILWLISYFPENGSFIEKLNEVTDMMKPTDTNILYCHEGINGVISNNSDKELSTKVFAAFDKVLVGHYHDRAILDNGRIEYIGASRQHNFGEDEEKGYTIVYTDGSTQFIKNQTNTRYTTIVIPLDEIDNTKQQITDAGEDTKIRLQIECDQDRVATIDKQSLIALGVTKIEIKTKEAMSYSPTQELGTKFNKDGLKDEYSRFCIQREIENIDMGLQYLDKIEGICGN